MKLLTLSPIDGRKNLIDVKAVNFSFREVAMGEDITVPERQQMLLSGMFSNNGIFRNFGQTVLIDLEDSDNQQVIPEADPENFSHSAILAGVEKTIPANQQMNVFGEFKNFGVLKNFGEMTLTKVFQDDPDQTIVLPDDNFSYFQIETNQTKTVPPNQQMVVVGMFKNFGTLVARGAMALLSGEVNKTEDEYLPPWIIEAGEKFVVKKNRILSIPRMFVNFGTLQNNGIVFLGD
jgi:hypothetical protein